MLSTNTKNLVNRNLIQHWYQLQRSWRAYLPGECLLCKQPVKEPWDLCSNCKTFLPRNDAACTRCAEPLASQQADLNCSRCQHQPPAFDQVIAPFLYSQPISGLLLKFKNHAQRVAGNLLLDLLLEELQQHNSEEVSGLVAIPGQTKRVKQRGINPPSWLALRLAWQLQKPFYVQGLRRVEDRPSQQKLSRKKRWLNPQGAFAASPQVSGKQLLLIDDVVTTGATCHWAAKALKEQGATSVTVLAVCRTPFN